MGDSRSLTDKFLNLNDDKQQLEYTNNIMKELATVDKEVASYYKNDTYVKLYSKYKECILCYNLMLQFIETIRRSSSLVEYTKDDEANDKSKIKKKKNNLLEFIKKFKDISEIVILFRKDGSANETVKNEFKKYKLIDGEDDLKSKVNSSIVILKSKLNSTLDSVETLFREIGKEREEVNNKKTSSVVYVYYGDPALADKFGNSNKKKDKRVREDIVKIDHLDTNCTDKFSCALNHTVERSEDFLKSTLNTFNGVESPVMKKKAIHTSYFDKSNDNKAPYYLLWDDQRDYSKIEYKTKDTSGGKKFNRTKKIKNKAE